MKRLGVYAFIAVLLGSIIGPALSPPHAHAASYDVTTITSEDYEILKRTANDIDFQIGFTSSLGLHSIYANKYLDFLKEDYASTKDLVTTTKSSLEVQVLNEYIAYLNQRLQSITNPSEKDDISKILILAKQKLSGAITRVQLENGAITTGEATTQNAEAAKTATQALADRSTGVAAEKCKITDFSLVECVDVLFTFIIKNTLLQIAGFLVWLTANMLNYAIQISILDFAKWAPTTLYPLWIVIRQIVSLVVVFAGLYLGFMYIIGREDTFGKYVGWLIIFALFVNFSYPVTRALIDVSNIVSLNVYSSSVGSKALATSFTDSATTLGADTAGALIMQKLGLEGLVGSAVDVSKQQSGIISSISSTPGALITLAFVLYAAYIFFMATAIIAMRTAVLVFLIVASPLLLIDSVIPKLGDVSMKMRKLFFEQLVVAPVFMIMLALTLKFMDIFQAGGVLRPATATALTGGAGSVTTFFAVLMMLIMLHIMIKVTKSLAGQAGLAATNFMGKVGGFGLGVAAGGAGLLARGSIGAVAARARDSGWMNNMQASRTGRGLYSLTNSLAQSTFDTRNIGFVNKGMASAGMGLGKGSNLNYDTSFAARQEQIAKKYESIQDPTVRQKYYDNMRNGPLSRMANKTVGRLGYETDTTKIAKNLDLKEVELKKKEATSIEAFTKGDDETRKEMLLKAQAGNDRILAGKLSEAQKYFNIKGVKPDEITSLEGELAKLKQDTADEKRIYAEKKAALEERKKLYLQEVADQKSSALSDLDSKTAIDIIDKDPFVEIQKENLKNIKKLEDELRGMEKGDAGYDEKREALRVTRTENEKMVSDLRKSIKEQYFKKNYTSSSSPNPSASSTSPNPQNSGPSPVDIELPDEHATQHQYVDTVHPGGSDTSGYASSQYQVPAYLRTTSFRQIASGRNSPPSAPAGQPNTPKPSAPSPQGQPEAATTV